MDSSSSLNSGDKVDFSPLLSDLNGDKALATGHLKNQEYRR